MGFMESYAEFERLALSLTPDGMADLDDEDLEAVLRARVFHILRNQFSCNYALAVSGMTKATRTALILYMFNDEIQNGGLCQYFVNSTSKMAPFVAEALKIVGAVGFEALFTGFCTKNRIDLTDLSSFETDALDDYEALCERYSFDEFDYAYCDLYDTNPIEPLIAAYARRHLDEF